MHELTYVCDMCGKVDKASIAQKTWRKAKLTSIHEWANGYYKEWELCPNCASKVQDLIGGK